ncbi:hypothetical protein KEM55_006578 [Ascosphaera atra]|nr:hypothetical protein KEM55_006578 [Ascosphaera atra]
MSNPTQLFLLADHIKLSLLEWQRAKSLDMEPNAQENEISRSLESLRLGIEDAERKSKDSDDDSAAETREQVTNLRIQYQDLLSQFDVGGSDATNAGLSAQGASLGPSMSPGLDDDEQAQHVIRSETTIRQPKPQHPKNVRFTTADRISDPDTLSSYTDADTSSDANRAALFPYRDDPSSSSPNELDQSSLSNPEIHSQHQLIMQEQDDQLDRLGESIGRQHQLSIQIGDELEGQVHLLDDVDSHVDRHQNRMDGARQRLGRIRRGNSNDRKGMCAIVGLIIILVVLIAILK